MKNKVLLVSSYLVLAEPIQAAVGEEFQVVTLFGAKDVVASISKEPDNFALVIIGGGVVSPIGGMPAMLLKIREIRKYYEAPMLFASGNPDNNEEMASAAGEKAYPLINPGDLLAMIRKILEIK